MDKFKLGQKVYLTRKWCYLPFNSEVIIGRVLPDTYYILVPIKYAPMYSGRLYRSHVTKSIFELYKTTKSIDAISKSMLKEIGSTKKITAAMLAEEKIREEMRRIHEKIDENTKYYRAKRNSSPYFTLHKCTGMRSITGEGGGYHESTG